MIKFLGRLNEEFLKVSSQSYFMTNTSKKITYPYLTYEVSDENIELNVDGFYIDVDIFNKGTSYVDIFTLENKLKAHFKDLDILTDDFLLRFSYTRANTIRTGDDLLLRRNIQMYCKIDWRKK